MPTIHSPTPWSEFRDSVSHEVIDKNGDHICTIEPVNGLNPLARQDANARLIAAAPELLDAAKLAEDMLSHLPDRIGGIGTGNVKERLRSAIAKATP